MDRFTDEVDVFHGCGAISAGQYMEGLPGVWRPFKGKAGNTSPAAVLPFGKYSVCAYSGGYPTGYGVNPPNYGEEIRPFSSEMPFYGFSHLQESGTGAIGVYYNYAIVKPFLSNGAQPPYHGADETAAPGFYAVKLKEIDTLVELTVSDRAAFHRYTFPDSAGRISVNFSHDGLSPAFGAPFHGTGKDLCISQPDDHHLYATVVLQGVKLFFAVDFLGDGFLNNSHIFECAGPGPVTVRVSYAASCPEDAIHDLNAAETDFDAVRCRADIIWNRYLSCVEIDTADPTDRRIFYSNLYHSLIKPSDWKSQGFLWKGAPFVVDFATLWDIYKTALPWIYTFYPEISADIVGMLHKLGQALHTFPNTFLLSVNMSIEPLQARMLAQHTLYDAWKRDVRADWVSVVDTMLDCSDHDEFRSFEKTGRGIRATHTLDMAEASRCIAEMCSAFGRGGESERYSRVRDYWQNAFDPHTGLLYSDSDYYEGNHWNYSFRLLHDMERRIELAGGKEAFRDLLDRFFGFTGEHACFEGFNNETDMETPYAYHYIGEYGKLAQIISAADRTVFRGANGGTDSSGIPGNNDSGALSSCYLWNTLGIFPVSGQNLMLITAPKFKRTVLRLANGNKLIIEKSGNGMVPVSSDLNGKPLKKLQLSVSDMMLGGTLCIRTQKG